MGDQHSPVVQPTQDQVVFRFSPYGGAVEVKPQRKLTEAEFHELCAENCHLRIEQDKNGNLIIMPPTDFDSGVNEGLAYGYLFNWWLSAQTGLTLSPSTGFNLPDSSICSADGAWASGEKVAGLTAKERKKFAPLVPDFIMEVRSSSDRLGKLKKKMTDVWMANGVRLAWLIDPKMKRAYVYRQGRPVEELKGFDRSLLGEEVCPGFLLDLRKFL